MPSYALFLSQVDILVNNAGVAFGRTLLQLTDQQIETTYNVNILSHYWVGPWPWL